MRVTIFSTGPARGLFYHLSKEGHNVDCMTQPPQMTHNTDLSIFDASFDPKIAEAYRTRGTKVLGLSSWVRLLETDASYKHACIRALGYAPVEPGAVGDAVTVSFLFNGQNVISQMLVFPYKRMMSCDVGTDVECSGYVAYFNVAKSALVTSTITHLEKFLRRAAHKGHFCVDYIITPDGPQVTDISATMNKAYTTAVYSNTKLQKSDVLLRILDETSHPIPYTDPWTSGVLVSIVPYPFLVPKDPKKMTGLNAQNLKYFWFVDVSQDGEHWVCGKRDGCIGYVTARGASVQEVIRRPLRTLASIKVDGIQYRGDIGRDVYTRLERLQAASLV